MNTDLQTIDIGTRKISDWAASPRAQQQIAAAVNEMIPTEMFISHMLVALEDKKVSHCTNGSKARAFMECAAMGVLPTLKQAALIPREMKDEYGKPSGHFEVTVMITWQGFKALMERHPDILEVIGVLVHTNDTIAIAEGEPRHSYDPYDENREFHTFDDVRGGYCKIIYRDGRPPKYHFVRRGTIKQAKDCSKAARKPESPWNTFFYEMCLKTLYRNAYARQTVPVDPVVAARLQRAINLDDLNLGNDPANISTEAAQEHVEQARKLRQLADQKPPAPEPEEPSAAEGSQVDPAVDAAEGVDEPSPETDQAELTGRYIARVRRLRTRASIENLSEEAFGMLDTAGYEAFTKVAAERLEMIGEKPPADAEQEELFDTSATAMEAGG